MPSLRFELKPDLPGELYAVGGKWAICTEWLQEHLGAMEPCAVTFSDVDKSLPGQFMVWPASGTRCQALWVQPHDGKHVRTWVDGSLVDTVQHLMDWWRVDHLCVTFEFALDLSGVERMANFDVMLPGRADTQGE